MAEIQGLAELERTIAAMNKELESQLPEITLAGAAIVEAEIAARAPRDTGALAASLDAKADHRRGSASATVAVEHSDKGGAEHYAIYLEYGTSKMPAEPFFRPGVEASKEKVGQLMQEQILKVIQK